MAGRSLKAPALGGLFTCTREKISGRGIDSLGMVIVYVEVWTVITQMIQFLSANAYPKRCHRSRTCTGYVSNLRVLHASLDSEAFSLYSGHFTRTYNLHFAEVPSSFTMHRKAKFITGVTMDTALNERNLRRGVRNFEMINGLKFCWLLVFETGIIYTVCYKKCLMVCVCVCACARVCVHVCLFACVHRQEHSTTTHVQMVNFDSITLWYYAQFILRREALCLYREFLRVSRDVGGDREREDMRRWVRGEFDKWRHTTDEVKFALEEWYSKPNNNYVVPRCSSVRV